MLFFKIRANGAPSWQGSTATKVALLSRYSAPTQRAVLGEWKGVLEHVCAPGFGDCPCGSGLVRFGLYGSVGGKTWTRWRQVNGTDLFTTIRCWEEYFGRHPFTADPAIFRGHRHVCQCRPNVRFAPGGSPIALQGQPTSRASTRPRGRFVRSPIRCRRIRRRRQQRRP